MRLRPTVWIVIIAGCCASAHAADLQKEDLRSVQEAFRKKDPALEWFQADSKKAIDAVWSVLAVDAAPVTSQPVGLKREMKPMPVPGKSQTGVFIVSGQSNRVHLVLDVLPVNGNGFPTIDRANANSVVLDFGDGFYGLYYSSIKYFYDVATGKPPVKVRFGKLALRSSIIQKGTLLYTAFALDKVSQIAIEPRPGEAPPDFKVTRPPVPEIQSIPEPAPMELPDGRRVLITDTPPGQPHRAAGVAIVSKAGTREFYPVPVPATAWERQLPPPQQAPGEIENNIGPYVGHGSTIWFANSFYDGEGTSGVGAIGSFDLRTNKFEMRYLPEIAPWSGSAIRLDGEDLWIGLMRQPEGAAFSGGLLRYNTRTGAVGKYDIPDYIHTIDRVGDTIYCGTANGLYLLRGQKITHLRFEPDSIGKLTMTAE